MTNLKKMIALLLALTLCVGLFAACGSKDDEAVKDQENAETNEDANAEAGDSDFAYVADKGNLVIGYTEYEPMNYVDENGELTGFETEFAKAVCEKLGVEPEFVVINWETKEVELAGKSIDCIWNGLTIDEDRKANMGLTVPYLKNAQVIVVNKDSGITSTADLVGKTVVAESGSAGEAQLIGEGAEENLAQANYIKKTTQADCLVEVKAGTADAAVLDLTLANAMVGEGTDYDDLMMIPDLSLVEEYYGIAFRKGSDIVEKVNAIIAELAEDGTLPALAEKYGLVLAPELAE